MFIKGQSDVWGGGNSLSIRGSSNRFFGLFLKNTIMIH